ncbi:phosphatidylinositol 3-and 4-kinase domain-containing protein, putative [Eimeria mitis]|uniref:Phosphatidylinositol 3-and 4-kinase domain-containing protein, putative n=1 Tax=Eimeria mitis TaxID=44415 RepID=U6KA84_9EIME|nr:phosphatidylinositol 3-and 4-kinase domain-containing protein, putative [Eimeria mitis]CDJ33731.1 phosphatidylinositol 3-and 4-kinase domain-containing protein, putative [Eimeria mitis]
MLLQQQQQGVMQQQQQQRIRGDVQGVSTLEGNKMAMKAILKVQSKLQGFDREGEAPLSVPAYVERLLNTAQNPHNLSRLFAGWMPFA